MVEMMSAFVWVRVSALGKEMKLPFRMSSTKGESLASRIRVVVEP